MFECTKDNPWAEGKPTPVRHHNTHEVGEQENGYPGGDIEKLMCVPRSRPTPRHGINSRSAAPWRSAKIARRSCSTITIPRAIWQTRSFWIQKASREFPMSPFGAPPNIGRSTASIGGRLNPNIVRGSKRHNRGAVRDLDGSRMGR